MQLSIQVSSNEEVSCWLHSELIPCNLAQVVCAVSSIGILMNSRPSIDDAANDVGAVRIDDVGIHPARLDRNLEVGCNGLHADWPEWFFCNTFPLLQISWYARGPGDRIRSSILAQSSGTSFSSRRLPQVCVLLDCHHMGPPIHELLSIGVQ